MQAFLNGAWPTCARLGFTTIVSSAAIFVVILASAHDNFLTPSHRAVDALIAAMVTPSHGQPQFSRKTERTVIKLPPGRSIEAKVGMPKGTRVEYTWSVEGGTVNFIKHGESEEREDNYSLGLSSSGGTGVLEAGFDGSHGWEWRNKGRKPVEISLTVTGDFNFLLTSPLSR